MQGRTWVMGIAGVCTALLMAADANGYEDIDVAKLPKAVKATLTKRYPKAKLASASTDKEDDVPVFRVYLAVEKQDMLISLQADGTVRWIGKPVPAEKLPKAVKSAVTAKYAKSKIASVTEVYNVRDGKEVLEYYEVEVSTKTNQARILTIELDGEITLDEAVKEA